MIVMRAAIGASAVWVLWLAHLRSAQMRSHHPTNAAMRIVFRIAATLVLVGWAVGTAAIRGWTPGSEDIAFVVCLGSFLLLRKQESSPAGSRADALRMSFVLALASAMFALVVGLLFEALVAAFRDGQAVSFWLRILWHPVCALLGTFFGQCARRWPGRLLA